MDSGGRTDAHDRIGREGSVCYGLGKHDDTRSKILRRKRGRSPANRPVAVGMIAPRSRAWHPYSDRGLLHLRFITRSSPRSPCRGIRGRGAIDLSNMGNQTPPRDQRSPEASEAGSNQGAGRSRGTRPGAEPGTGVDATESSLTEPMPCQSSPDAQVWRFR
jgi:hypothetical protein